jgi:hypothetical protein
MKLFDKKKRTFKIVNQKKILLIKQVGKIFLENDEQITFITSNQKKHELDFVRKNWGFYPFPSINSRLKFFGFKVCLTFNLFQNKFNILVVEKKKIKNFLKYIRTQNMKIVFWFNDKKLKELLNYKKNN